MSTIWIQYTMSTIHNEDNRLQYTMSTMNNENNVYTMRRKTTMSKNGHSLYTMNKMSTICYNIVLIITMLYSLLTWSESQMRE